MYHKNSSSTTVSSQNAKTHKTQRICNKQQNTKNTKIQKTQALNLESKLGKKTQKHIKTCTKTQAAALKSKLRGENTKTHKTHNKNLNNIKQMHGIGEISKVNSPTEQQGKHKNT